MVRLEPFSNQTGMIFSSGVTGPDSKTDLKTATVTNILKYEDSNVNPLI